MDELEQEIRNLLADMLVGPELKERMGGYPCTGLARKIRSGFDQNPRTIAAILVVKRILQAPKV